MPQKYYRTIFFLIVLILVLGLLVVIFTQRAVSAPVASSIATTTVPVQAPMAVITPDNNNTTVHLKQGERFVINLGTLNWTLVFSPENIIGRVLNTPNNTGQGIYQALRAGTTVLHGTGAPICKAGEMCPDFMEAMTITFVVE